MFLFSSVTPKKRKSKGCGKTAVISDALYKKVNYWDSNSTVSHVQYKIHRGIESLRLEKTFKINKSNWNPTKLCSEAPHVHTS